MIYLNLTLKLFMRLLSVLCGKFMKQKDWRITNQKKYLDGAELVSVQANQMESDHEHCVFCWEKVIKEDTENQFYATLNLKHWICEKCFIDFKNQFKWVVRGNGYTQEHD